jgi:hypothetical protein
MNLLEKHLLKLRFNIWARLKANFSPSFNLSHSQFGEDMAVRFLTGEIKQGFYVDIGAHHPVYYSNTHHFYCKGWRGINIDGTPGIMETFDVLRSRDINLEMLLHPDKQAQLVELYMFDQPALNTFDPVMAEKALAAGTQLLGKKMLETQTLEQVLDTHLPQGTEIDLMSIDIEGLDEAIILAHNWGKYKPKVLVFEKHDIVLKEIETTPVIEHLSKYGYQIVAKCGPSLILQLRSSKLEH